MLSIFYVSSRLRNVLCHKQNYARRQKNSNSFEVKKTNIPGMKQREDDVCQKKRKREKKRGIALNKVFLPGC